jgi:hypothetical protein
MRLALNILVVLVAGLVFLMLAYNDNPSENSCNQSIDSQISSVVEEGYKFSMFSGDNGEFSGALIRGGSVVTGQGNSITEACDKLIHNHKKFRKFK